MPLTCELSDFQFFKRNLQFILFREKGKMYSESNKVVSPSVLAIKHYIEYIFACGAEIKHIPEQLRREPENDNV
jgi:hypothetical protein